MGNPDGGAKGGGVRFWIQEKLKGGILGGVRVFSLWFGSLCRVCVPGGVLAGLICAIIGVGFYSLRCRLFTRNVFSCRLFVRDVFSC